MSMRTSDEIRNVLELFNRANEHQETEGSNIEAVADALRWVFFTDMPDHTITQWLPPAPPTGDPLPGHDNPTPGTTTTVDPGSPTTPEPTTPAP